MADQEVALQVKTPPPFAGFNPASPLEAAQTIQGNQTALQTGQTQLQMLGRQNQLQDVQYRNQIIANAAAHGIDSDTWNSAFQSAVDRGVPEAAQFIGRYNPILQQRVMTAYGAAPGRSAAAPGAGGTAAAPDDMFARMYQNYSAPQLANSLQRTNTFLQAIQTIKDQPSLDRAVSYLTANGFPNAASLFGSTYSPLQTPQQLSNLFTEGQQRVQWLQNRVAGASTGAPAPLVKNDVQTVDGVAYSVDPYSKTAVPLTNKPWAVTETTDMFGQKHPIAYNPMNPAESISIRPTAPASTSPFTAFATQMNRSENDTGNPAAKNPLSSAAGNGQFIDSTWLETIKSARPDLVKGMNDKQILALRANPALSQEMTEAYAHSNATKLSSDGLPVTTATLALAHRFGPQGAETILNAAPDAKLSDILPKNVIDANPQLANITAGQYAQTMAHQFGNTPMTAIQTPTIGNFDMANVDPNQHGWDYLRQFPVEVQDATRAYMNGGVMPTGNPRNIGISTLAKTVAQKVATDLGRPELADDTLYPQRRQMQVELGKTTSPQALGGQITFGGTALGHLATYAQDLADLGNWTGGLTTGGHIANWVRAAGPEQAGKINKASADAQHYGQEISKFYAGGPAGEAERSRFLNANAGLNPTTATPQELAGLIRGERDLIPERFAQIKGNVENVLGPAVAAKALARMDIQGSLDKINRAIARLDPNGPEAQALKSAQPTQAPTAPVSKGFVNGGLYQDQGGNKARFQDGKFVPVT